MMDRNGLAILERLDRAADAMQAQASSIAALATGLKLNGIVYSGTVPLGPDGSRIVEARSNFASATVRPQGSRVVVSTGGQSLSAPSSGPGVFDIPGDIERTVAIAGNVLVLNGTPGALVAVTLWERIQSPASASTHPATVDVAGGPVRVGGSIASVVLAVANPSRRGLTVFNENPAGTVLNLCFGPIASAVLYTVQIVGGAFYEVQGPPFYRGVVSGIWTAATGAAQVTELQ